MAHAGTCIWYIINNITDNDIYFYFIINTITFIHSTFESFKMGCMAFLSKTHIKYNSINNSAGGFIDERSGKVNSSARVRSYFGVMFDVWKSRNLLISAHHSEPFSKTIYLLYFSENGPKLRHRFQGIWHNLIIYFLSSRWSICFHVPREPTLAAMMEMEGKSSTVGLPEVMRLGYKLGSV